MIIATITRTEKPTSRIVPGVEGNESTIITVFSNIRLYEVLDDRLESKRDGAYGYAFTGLSKFYTTFLTNKIFQNDIINNTFKVVSTEIRRRRTFITVERLR